MRAASQISQRCAGRADRKVEGAVGRLAEAEHGVKRA